MPFVKATLKGTHMSEDDEAIPVLYNPTELQVDHGVQYAEQAIPGQPVPQQHFVRGHARTLSVELFLDVRRSTDTTLNTDLAKLRALIQIHGELHAPPVVTFTYGSTPLSAEGSNAFTGVVTSLTERFVLFDESGNVQRARVTLKLTEVEEPGAQRRRMDLKSPDRTRTWVVREGDRLSDIAHSEYGDAALWRVIADANDLHRPRDLAPGLLLTLPAQ